MVAMLLMLSLISLPKTSHAQIINYPDTDYLDLSSPIVLEFDHLIQWNAAFSSGYYSTFAPGAATGFSQSHPGIRFTEQSTNSPVEINLKIDSTRKAFIITPNPSPTSPGAAKWEEDKMYRLEIINHIITDSSNSLFLPLAVGAPPITYSIGTYHLTFKELMSGTREINYLIQDYTPRKIKVKAADRYVDEVSIIHKRQELVQNSTTESVTNIDISVDNKAIKNPNGDVKKIEVTPKRNGSAIQPTKVIDNLNIIPNTGKKLYDFAFTRLPDTTAFDIEIILYDKNDLPIDTRIIKVPLESKTTTTITQKNRYKLAGRTFTLYDLLNKQKDMQTLLDENMMDEIKVWVVQQ